MSSTRLPGKVLRRVLDRPLIDFLVERLGRVHLADERVIATTSNAADDAIVEWCRSHGIAFTRGPEEDVLARYVQAARLHEAETIVRITADCPLIDPEVVDRVIAFYQAHADSYDYVSNVLVRTYPRGMDTEVFSASALERAHREARGASEREHVTPYLYGHPELFRLANVPDFTERSQYRLTIDTREDFELVRRVLEALYPRRPEFDLEDMIRLLEEHPEWVAINAGVEQRRTS